MTNGSLGGWMRAFLSELDWILAIALGAGLIVGAAWLVAPGIGFGVAGLAIPMATILLFIRRRWLEYGAFLLGSGIVPAVGYRIGGPPLPMPSTGTGGIRVEYFAPAAADLLAVAGVIALTATMIVELREGVRREGHAARHEERKRERLTDSPS